MNIKLAAAIALVNTLLGAFGGVLMNQFCHTENYNQHFLIAPVVSLIINLVIAIIFFKEFKSAITRNIKLAIVLLAVISLANMYLYYYYFNEHTFEYPNAKHETLTYLKGTNYTADITDYLKNMPPGYSDRQLVEDFGGPDGIYQIWTAESIRGTKFNFFFIYTLFITTLSALVFSCLELLSPAEANPKP